MLRGTVDPLILMSILCGLCSYEFWLIDAKEHWRQDSTLWHTLFHISVVGFIVTKLCTKMMADLSFVGISDWSMVDALENSKDPYLSY